MDIQLRNGLLFTSIKLIYKGASKVIRAAGGWNALQITKQSAQEQMLVMYCVLTIGGI